MPTESKRSALRPFKNSSKWKARISDMVSCVLDLDSSMNCAHKPACRQERHRNLTKSASDGPSLLIKQGHKGGRCGRSCFVNYHCTAKMPELRFLCLHSMKLPQTMIYIYITIKSGLNTCTFPSYKKATNHCKVNSKDASVCCDFPL